MEILSDATFKGSIKIYDSGGGSPDYGHVLSTGNCTLYLKGNGSEDNIHFQIGPDSNNIRFDLNRNDIGVSSRSAISVNAIRLTDAAGTKDPVKIEYDTNCNGGAIHIGGNLFDVYPDGSAYLNGNLSAGSISAQCIDLWGSSISHWTDLNNKLSFAKAPKTFSSPSIPANCTAFEFTGTAISDSNKTHIIQVQNTSTGRSVIAET